MSEEKEIKDFLGAVNQKEYSDYVRSMRGAITAVDATLKTVTVIIGAGVMEIPGVNYFAHYTPTVGDQVHLFKVGQDIMVFGMIKRP